MVHLGRLLQHSVGKGDTGVGGVEVIPEEWEDWRDL